MYPALPSPAVVYVFTYLCVSLCVCVLMGGCRSPSPPPQYDSSGGRVNTREKRYRQRLEMERHRLIDEASRRNRDYVPPADYRKPTRFREKVRAHSDTHTHTHTHTYVRTTHA
jgi:hypothetical protein